MSLKVAELAEAPKGRSSEPNNIQRTAAMQSFLYKGESLPLASVSPG